jgi:hypothetical protein
LLLLYAGVYIGVCRRNRENFDLTSSVFLQRILNALLFFKGGFFDIGKAELYGFLWLSLTYVIILGIAANLNEYFTLSVHYVFNTTLVLKALGISAIFLISEPFIYYGVVKCLGSYVTTIEVKKLIYSR